MKLYNFETTSISLQVHNQMWLIYLLVDNDDDEEEEEEEEEDDEDDDDCHYDVLNHNFEEGRKKTSLIPIN
jgi:hypothetical protein